MKVHIGRWRPLAPRSFTLWSCSALGGMAGFHQGSGAGALPLPGGKRSFLLPGRTARLHCQGQFAEHAGRSCRRWGGGGGRPFCRPVPAGRQAVYQSQHGRGPRSCEASRGTERPELLNVPPPAGQSAPGQFGAPVLSPERQAVWKHGPFSGSLAVGKSLRLPAFLLSHSGRMWIPVLSHKWPASQVSRSLPPVFAFRPHRSCGAHHVYGRFALPEPISSPGLGVWQS